MAEKTLEERVAELEGTNVNMRVRALEVVTERQARQKAKKKTLTGILFPYPITAFGQPGEDGVVFKAIFPCDGMLVSAIVEVDGPLGDQDNPPTIDAQLTIEKDVYDRQFEIRNKVSEVNLDLPVLKGAKLQIVADKRFEGVWTGLLFVPAVSDAVIRKIVEASAK